MLKVRQSGLSSGISKGMKSRLGVSNIGMLTSVIAPERQIMFNGLGCRCIEVEIRAVCF